MEVYLEVTYLLNAFIILLTFEFLCFLLNQQLTIKELLKYTLTYNISILFLFIDFIDGFLLFYSFVLSLIYFKKSTYIYYPLLLFIYISIISFLEMILPLSSIFQCILIVEGFGFVSMMILAVLVIVICYFYIMFCKYKIKPSEMVKVCVNGKECEGFIDNGNEVFYKGHPVIFLTQEMIGDYVKIDSIEIETATSIKEVDITKVDEMMIHHHVFHQVYVGVITIKQYDCILNSELLGGLL